VRRQLAVITENGGLEVIVVDDGSADATTDAAEATGADRVVTLPENQGKGAAVRAGMKAATGSTRAFLDADLAYSPDQVLSMLKLTEAAGTWSSAAAGAPPPVQAGRLRQLGGLAT
jgi:glycosyltransferase involved in cell wall biosynthesis